MANSQPPTLEQIVRAAQREHAAVQYPGDLAADLGLTDDAPRGWLRRWRPALALCAVLALAAGGVGLWALLSPSPTTPPQPIADAVPESPGPVAPNPMIEQQNTGSGTAANPITEVTITREQFAAVKQQVADMRADAKRTAQVRLSQLRATDRTMKTSVSMQPITGSAVGLAAVPRISLSRPSGLSLPAYSPSSFTKDLS
ncbi:hypothetical protein OT109_02225 [Phycisphaeraceae bacterium D3-23]